MNAHTPAIVTEVEKIEDALDQLLTTAIRTDQDRAREPDYDRPPVSLRDSVAAYVERLTASTPAQRRAHDFLDRPVGEALRQAIRILGERLFEVGGLKLMSDVLYRVAERDRVQEHRRIGIMDRRWDGIGQTPTSAGWRA